MAIQTEPRPAEPVAALMAQPKEPLTRATGPYGHPFHPMLVTVPIGAWISALVFDIAARVQDGGNAALVEGSYWLIGIGFVGAVVAAVFGLLDLLRIPGGTPAFRTGLAHFGLNAVVLVLQAVGFFWRAGDYDEYVQPKSGQTVLLAAAIAVLAVSGWLGGRLAYRYGVRVAAERDQADGFRGARANRMETNPELSSRN